MVSACVPIVKLPSCNHPLNMIRDFAESGCAPQLTASSSTSKIVPKGLEQPLDLFQSLDFTLLTGLSPDSQYCKYSIACEHTKASAKASIGLRLQSLLRINGTRPGLQENSMAATKACPDSCTGSMADEERERLPFRGLPFPLAQNERRKGHRPHRLLHPAPLPQVTLPCPGQHRGTRQPITSRNCTAINETLQ
jgi:hypothetical protein